MKESTFKQNDSIPYNTIDLLLYPCHTIENTLIPQQKNLKDILEMTDNDPANQRCISNEQ